MNPLLKKILLGLLGLLVIITIVLVALRFYGAKPVTQTPSSTSATSSLPGSGNVPGNVSPHVPGGQGQGVVPTITPRIAGEDQVLLQQLTIASRNFAERYGSYSTQGDFANLKALLPVSTTKMQTEMQATIQKGIVSGTAFYGVTTQALSATPSGTVSKSAPVQVVVQTQRTTTEGTKNTVTYQKISLTLVYQSGVWLVDSAQWQ